jgi:hypothetical protein
MARIAQSVGHGGANRDADVRVVQGLLNRYVRLLGLKALKVDGRIGPATVGAIRAFQHKLVGLKQVDGRVDPNGRTFKLLLAHLSPYKPAPGSVSAARLSGASWFRNQQAKYPNSDSLTTLDGSFKKKVEPFLAALKAAGVGVRISSTRRNKHRAYVMHHCWMIAKGKLSAAEVPLDPECDILWDHGSAAASVDAAQAMVECFGLRYQPSLNSRHIAGRAIDMTLSWAGEVKIKDALGRVHSTASPQDGSNPTLHKVAATYGVIKNLKDPPHWSDTGN